MAIEAEKPNETGSKRMKRTVKALNVKKLQIVNKVLQGESIEDATYAVYEGRMSAEKLMKDGDFNGVMRHYLGLKGLDEKGLMNKLYKLTKASRGVYFKGEKTAEDPDNEVRLKSVQTALRLLGYLSPKSDTTNNTMNITITPEQAERFLQIGKELKQLNG